MKNESYKMYRMCLKKKKYCTLKYANQKAHEYTLKYNKKTTVYFCPICGWYHLTTKES